MKKIFLGLALTFSLLASAQTKSYVSQVDAVLRNNGTVTYYNNVLDKLFNLLKDNYASQNVTDGVWKELEAVKPLALDNLVELVATAYLPLFTEEDVRHMNNFYSSELGKGMFTKQILSPEESKALESFYQTETGNKIVINQETLNASMQNISQNWTGNLYLQMVDNLEAKGYLKVN